LVADAKADPSQGSGVLVVAWCCADVRFAAGIAQPTGAAGMDATWQTCWVASSWW